MENSVSIRQRVSRQGHGLTGNIDNWDIKSHPMKKSEFGVWEIVLPPVDGQPAIPHNSKIQVTITLALGLWAGAELIGSA